MAEALISTDKLPIHCPVCLDQFHIPRSLPCLHTFCTSCLQTHISNVSHSSMFSSFPCPVCRASTKPPRPYSGRDTWSEQFPVNYVIVSIIDEAVTANAEAATSTGIACETHPDYTINLLCVDHDTLCCPMCIAICHRKCIDVTEVANIVRVNEVHEQISELTLLADWSESQVNKLNDTYATTLNHLEENKRSIEDKIKAETQTAITHLQTLECQTLQELDDKYKPMHEHVAINLEWCDHSKTVHKELQKELQNDSLKKMSDINEFIKIHNIKSKLAKVRVENMRSEPLRKKSFELDLKVNQTFQDIQLIEKLGEVYVRDETDKVDVNDGTEQQLTEYDRYSDVQEDSDLSDSEFGFYASNAQTVTNSHSSHNSELNGCLENQNDIQFIKTIPTTKSNCNGINSWITSMTLMKNNTIAACDHKTSSLKILRDGKVIANETRQSAPWSVANISKTEIALTYPQENKLRIFDVKYNTASWNIFETPIARIPSLSLSKTISTTEACYGMTSHNGFIIIACEDCLKLYKTDRYAFSQFFGQSLFRRAIDVAIDVSNKSLYVTDEAYNCVYAFTYVDGFVINTSTKFVYRHARLRCPQGLDVDTHGQVFVAGFVSRNIHVFNIDGQTLRIIPLTKRPWSLHIDKQRERLYISYYPEDEKNTDGNLNKYSLPGKLNPL